MTTTQESKAQPSLEPGLPRPGQPALLHPTQGEEPGPKPVSSCLHRTRDKTKHTPPFSSHPAPRGGNLKSFSTPRAKAIISQTLQAAEVHTPVNQFRVPQTSRAVPGGGDRRTDRRAARRLSGGPGVRGEAKPGPLPRKGRQPPHRRRSGGRRSAGAGRQRRVEFTFPPAAVGDSLPHQRESRAGARPAPRGPGQGGRPAPREAGALAPRAPAPSHPGPRPRPGPGLPAPTRGPARALTRLPPPHT